MVQKRKSPEHDEPPSSSRPRLRLRAELKVPDGVKYAMQRTTRAEQGIDALAHESESESLDDDTQQDELEASFQSESSSPSSDDDAQGPSPSPSHEQYSDSETHSEDDSATQRLRTGAGPQRHTAEDDLRILDELGKVAREHGSTMHADLLGREHEAELRQARCVAHQSRMFDYVLSLRIQIQALLSSRVVQEPQRLADRQADDSDESQAEVLLELALLSRDIYRLLQKLGSRSDAFVLADRRPPSGDRDYALGEELELAYTTARPWMARTLRQWQRKTAELARPSAFLASQQPATMGSAPFGADGFDAMQELEELVSKKPELVLRKVLGGHHSGSQGARFDDGELYRQLLRMVIEQAPDQQSQFAHLDAGVQQSLLLRSTRHQSRKEVDRRASKGRKLRFVAHEKLAGFLVSVPEEVPPYLNDLIGGLFGNRQ
ncbi:Protein BFR2 [Porphyridium purpureum]|uniref:Protein BFR2 n=1 Tax=Porphyridium purpureum TaxID=35688 RepID=A0A5J4YKY7_PORPP|nr:Protein BFR2 [Porphyridium purpureum]|eukprot:POR0085..scf244_11